MTCCVGFMVYPMTLVDNFTAGTMSLCTIIHWSILDPSPLAQAIVVRTVAIQTHGDFTSAIVLSSDTFSHLFGEFRVFFYPVAFIDLKLPVVLSASDDV